MSVTDTTLVTWCFTCAVDSYMLWHAPLAVWVYRNGMYTNGRICMWVVMDEDHETYTLLDGMIYTL